MSASAAATSAASSGSVSLPLLALQEAKTHSVVVETRDGRSYRGVLLSMDMETGNVTLGKGICTEKNGYKTATNQLTIRGTEVTVVRLPAVIKNAPFLKTDFIRMVKESRKMAPAVGGKLAQRAAKRAADKKGTTSGGAKQRKGDLTNVNEISKRIKEARKGKVPAQKRGRDESRHE